jgi:hypothetical protein
MNSNPRNAAVLILFALLSGGCSADTVLAARASSEPAFRLLAQADSAKAAETPAKAPEQRTPEEKKRVKSAVILLSVISGIALSGLLLIIAAISIRGLQRKLAGPTRLDREPADLFPPPPAPEPDEPPAAGTAAATDASSQETRLT